MSHQEQVEHIKKLIDTNYRRLRILEVRLAYVGHSADPALFLHIEDIRDEIKRLQAELVILVDNNNNTSEDTTVKSINAGESEKRVIIYLEGEISSFSEQLRVAVIAALATAIGIHVAKIKINSIHEGSIVFDLSIPFYAVERLRSLLRANDEYLHQLMVEKVIMEREYDINDQWIIKEGKFVHHPYTVEQVIIGKEDGNGDGSVIKEVKFASPYALLGPLIDAGLKFTEGKRRLKRKQWSDGIAELQEAVNIVGRFFDQRPVDDPFDREADENWSTIVDQLGESIGAINQKVKLTFGPDINLPYDSQIIYQMIEAKAYLYLAEAIRQSNWRSYLIPFNQSRQEIFTNLKKAGKLFWLCLRSSNFRVWPGILQIIIYQFALYLAFPIVTLGGGVIALYLIYYSLQSVLLPRLSPTLIFPISPPTSIISQPITFTLHCADGKTVAVDNQEMVIVPIRDAIIIETNVSPRSIGSRIITNDTKQFPYDAGQLGLDTVDFTFFTDQSLSKYITKSLTIKVVPKGVGGLCYQ